MSEDTHTESLAVTTAPHSPTRAGRRILHLPAKGEEAAADTQRSITPEETSKFSRVRSGVNATEGCDTPVNDKFAPCEFSTESQSSDAANEYSPGEEVTNVDPSTFSAPPAEPENLLPAKTKLELAIERCTALGEKSDTMITEKWGKRGGPILKESLNFLAEYEAASDAERKSIRKSLKAKSGVSREPNVENLPLIGVYMCVSCSGKTRTKAQRKEWGRFATVVKVAAAAPVTPGGAAEWLDKKTLNGILAEWRDMQKAAGKGERKPSVPKSLKVYTHLAAALAKGSEFQAVAKAELLKADAAIAQAMSEAAAKAPATAAVVPAEEVAANA